MCAIHLVCVLTSLFSLIQTGLSHIFCHRTVVMCAAQVGSSVVIGPAKTHFLVRDSGKVELWDIKDF